MVYNVREYYPKFSMDYGSIRKNIVSKKFVNFIFSLLNSKKYPSIELFYSSNKSFDEFIKLYLNSNGISAYKYNPNAFEHFKETMTEDDYQKMVRSIFDLTDKKKQFDADKIQEQNIDDKSIVSYVNPDNSYYLIQRKDEDFIKKLEDKQEERASFHTIDGKQNAENMFIDLSQNVNETLNLITLKELISNIDALNESQVSFVRRVMDYVDDIEGIKVDIDKKIVIGKDNKIIKINSNDEDKEIDEPSNYSVEKGHQKVLSSAPGIKFNSDIEGYLQ